MRKGPCQLNCSCCATQDSNMHNSVNRKKKKDLVVDIALRRVGVQ